MSPLSRAVPVGLLLGLALVGCVEPPDGVPPPPPPMLLDGGPATDAGPVICSRPLEGCECEPGTSPIDCYPEATRTDEGARICHRGTRSCRAGEWTACESLESWVIGRLEPGRATAAVLGSSEACESCNPGCTRTTDEPDDGDDNDNLEYCDPPGGLCIVGATDPPPPTPAGCDVYHELAFGESATTTVSFPLSQYSEYASSFEVDDATTAIDERNFVESQTAVSCPSCVPGIFAQEYCAGCSGGSTVGFEFSFENDLVVPDVVDQDFTFELYNIGWRPADGYVALESVTTVCIRVPASVPGECRDIGYGCGTGSDCCSGVCRASPAADPTFSILECAGGGAACRDDGGLCELSIDCCEGACVGGFCDDAASCANVGDACLAGGDCCTGICNSGSCQPRACFSQNARCGNDGECCSGNCKSNGRCGSGSICTVTGGACGSDGDCCSTTCGADRTCENLSFCRAAGEPCTDDGQCCGLSCAAGGFCEIISTECLPRYEPCARNSECCGLRCDTDLDGVDRCLALGGCRVSGPTPGSPFGENCASDEQCCSGLCAADGNGDMRCTRLNTANSGCSITPAQLAPNGELCNNDCQCVSGDCERLAVSTAHSRCGDGLACQGEGAGCAFGEDCCQGSCVLWPDDVYRCGPPSDGGGYTMGSFERVWDGLQDPRDDGTPGPAENERPDWGDFSWTATVPPHTRLRFEVQTANTLADLDSANVVSFNAPPTTSPVNIGDLLVSNDEFNFLRFLRITVVLISEDGTETPVLHDLSLEWLNTPTE